MSGKTLSTVFLATSISLLAAAIVYFALKLEHLGQTLPEVLATVDEASNQVQGAVEEAGRIRALVPTLQQELVETRSQISPILHEVALVRAQVPAILQEAEQIRKTVPDIVGQAQMFNEQVPTVMSEVSAIRQQIPAIVKESQQIREMVPPVLAEVQATREAAPELLTRVENIMATTDKLGKATTEGAVTGVVTGVIKTPFKVLGSFGQAIFGSSSREQNQATEKDLNLIRRATYQLLATGQAGDTLDWSNAQSGNSGNVILLKQDGSVPASCRLVKYSVNLGRQKTTTHQVGFCRDNAGGWQPMDI